MDGLAGRGSCLLVSAALALVITLGGWTRLEGGKIFALLFVAVYVLFAFLVEGAMDTWAGRYVQETLDVPLPRPRDQVTTKELPEFVQLRGHVYRAIKRPAASRTYESSLPS